jgi:hypothetical protein
LRFRFPFLFFQYVESNSAGGSGDQHYGDREIAGFVIGGFFLFVIAIGIFAFYAFSVVPRAKQDAEAFSSMKSIEMQSN